MTYGLSVQSGSTRTLRVHYREVTVWVNVAKLVIPPCLRHIDYSCRRVPRFRAAVAADNFSRSNKANRGCFLRHERFVKWKRNAKFVKKNNGRPVVCGTDFSAVASEAVDIAAAMARQLGTKLVLVHVDELQGSLPSDPFLLEDAISQRRAELDREAQRLRDLGTSVEEKFLSGSAFDELVTAATEASGRLIVVGAVGHGPARRLLVGSVAERTAETSPIPTLVVRPGGRLASWIRGEHALKILVGYDFSAASDAALDWVNQLSEIGKFQTTCTLQQLASG